MATYAIGDIQGCYDEFRLLLEKIKFRPAVDHLWLAGDIVSRGPKSLEVLQYAYDNQEHIDLVLGNHDLHLLASYYLNLKTNPRDKLKAIFEHSDSETLIRWLRKQPVAHYDKQLNFFMTHAGVPPGWDLQQTLACAYDLEMALSKKRTALKYFANMYGNQPVKWSDKLRPQDKLRFTTNALTRMRFCNKKELSLEFNGKGAPSRRSKRLTPWYELNPSILRQTQVIFGHWAALNGKVQMENLFALDTGCVWGNQLTALCLEDKKYYRVKALKTWA